MKAQLSFLLFLSVTFFAAAESPPPPFDLNATSCWVEVGEWKMAGKVVGDPHAKKWKHVKPGTSILYNGDKGKSINLTSKQTHGDAELEIEFMIPKGSNSGVYLMNRYEVQILDSYGKADSDISYGDCGGIYERWDDSKPTKEEKGYEGTAPTTNACSAPGTWQKFHILFRAPRFDSSGKKSENARFVRVKHNGVVIHEDVEVTGPTRGGEAGPEVADAPLTVQGDHGPVAFRKFLVRPTKFK